jgi:hypothetical protein
MGTALNPDWSDMTPRQSRLPILSALAASFVSLGAVGAAHGAISPQRFEISALGLHTLTGNPGTESHGMLSQASGEFFTALPSLPDGIRVCEFGISFHDNDAAHDVTATLERRNAQTGANPAAEPQVMATVKSNGANSTIRNRRTQSISNETVDTDRFAYFVRVSLPSGNNIDVVKLDLDLKLAC